MKITDPTGLFDISTEWVEDYKLEVQARPIADKIAQLYCRVAMGIEEEVMNNMPEEAVNKLLKQLLDQKLRRSLIRSDEEGDAVLELLSVLV